MQFVIIGWDENSIDCLVDRNIYSYKMDRALVLNYIKRYNSAPVQAVRNKLFNEIKKHKIIKEQETINGES